MRASSNSSAAAQSQEGNMKTDFSAATMLINELMHYTEELAHLEESPGAKAEQLVQACRRCLSQLQSLLPPGGLDAAQAEGEGSDDCRHVLEGLRALEEQTHHSIEVLQRNRTQVGSELGALRSAQNAAHAYRKNARTFLPSP